MNTMLMIWIFFNNYRFYTVSPEKRLVLKPEYKKLENREYLIYKFDETLVLLKPFIEHVSANFVKFETDEEEAEVTSHLNHYYYFDEETKTLKVDEARKISYQTKFHLDAFREYREEAFKKWDIIKTNSLIGLSDPITQEEKRLVFIYVKFYRFNNNRLYTRYVACYSRKIQIKL